MLSVSTDDGEDNGMRPGPFKRDDCCDGGQWDGQADGPAVTQTQPEQTQTQESGKQAQAEGASGEVRAGCSTKDSASASCSAGASAGVPTNSQQGAGLQQQQPCETEEEEEKGECPPQTNERQAKRKGYQARRRKLLFSIHAVNSNGTTERGMGEDGSAFSFSCESDYTSHSHCLLLCHCCS